MEDRFITVSPETPQSGYTGLQGQCLWNDDGLLIVTPATVLPDRCVCCNASESIHRTEVKVEVASQSHLVAAAIGKVFGPPGIDYDPPSYNLDFGLCPIHHRQRWKRRLLAFGLALCGVCLAYLSFAFHSLILFLPGILLLGGPFIWLYRRERMAIVMTRGNYFWIKGLGKPFMESLPPAK